MSNTLKLEIPPEWDHIDAIRLRASEFLRQRGLGASVVEAVTMVTCELTENAVKYGYFHGDLTTIEVELHIATGALVVEVRSPTLPPSEGSESLRRLDRMIQWIRGFQDPFQAFLERLREVSSQRLDNPESGLGLVRIAYEGRSVLDFYVSDQNVLAVSAVYQL